MNGRLVPALSAATGALFGSLITLIILQFTVMDRLTALEARVENLPYPSILPEQVAWRTLVDTHLNRSDIHQTERENRELVRQTVVEVLRQQNQ